MLSSSQIDWTAPIAFGQTQFANILRETGTLQNGTFIFCYRFLAIPDSRILGLNCQEKTIMRFGPPELLSPQNGSYVSIPNPILSWKPPIPFTTLDIRYELVLAELKKGQSFIEAIRTNFSILNIKDIQRRFLLYPNTAPQLTLGKSYVWQVAAFHQGIEIGATDIWKFTYEQKELDKDSPPTVESYRFVKPKLDGAYYIANEIIYFAYDNRKSQSILNYQIYPIENRGKSLKNLPKIKLKTGINRLDIEGKKIKGLKDKKRYLLVVTDESEHQYYLAFIYNQQKQ